jgi:hypothetical protein
MIVGHEAFRFAHFLDSQLEKLEEDITASGWEPARPLLIEKDPSLVKGYQIVHYPGTRREVWIGGPRQEHILMKRMPASG